MRRPSTSAPEYGEANTFGSGKNGVTEGSPGVTPATVLRAAQGNALIGEVCAVIEGNGLAIDSTKYNQMYTALQFDKLRQSIVRDSEVFAGTATTHQVTGFAAVTPADRDDGSICAVLVAESGETAYATLASLDETLKLIDAGSSYTGDFNGVLYVSRLSLVVAYGTAGEIQTSACATTLSWTRRKNGGNQIVAMADNGTTLIAVDDAGHLWTSTAGTSWTDAGALVGTTARDIDYGNSLWVVAEDGQVRTSSNGTSWTVRAVATAAQLFNCRWCSDLALWVACGDGTDAIWTSPDAITWTARVATSASSAVTVVVPVPGGVLVAGWYGAAAGSGYFTSGDGATWVAGRASRFAGFDDGGGKPNRPLILAYYPTVHEYKLMAAYGTGGQIRVFSAFV